MDLELALKLAQVEDDFASAELLLAKERSGPRFSSTETDSMFILTAHLKGFRREHIKINVNEDGTRIGISGQKSIHETVIVGSKVHKKEVQVKGFKKDFRIPYGIVLHEIEAKFSDRKSTLTISMPKLVKGIRGVGIEEVKEDCGGKQGSGISVMAEESDGDEEGPRIQNGRKKEWQESENNHGKATPSADSKVTATYGEEGDDLMMKSARPSSDKAPLVSDQETSNKEESAAMLNQEAEAEEQEEGHKKRQKLRGPILAGSAFLVPLIVFVIHFIRTRNQSSKKRQQTNE